MGADAGRELRRDLLRQAWPLVLQNLGRTLMFFVDTAVLGRVGTDAMAAMGVAGPIAYTVLSVLAAFAVGTLATTARAWGGGDPEKVEREAATAVALAALVGLPLSAAGAAFLPRMAGLLPLAGAPQVTPLAEAFLFWQGASLGFVCVDLAASAVLRAAGRTGILLGLSVATNALNVFLLWVLAFGNLGAPALGVEGAGLATAAAASVQGILTLGVLFTPRSPVRLRPASFARVTRDSASRLVRVGLPAALEPLALQSGFLVYTGTIGLLGAASMAAHRVALAVESITFMTGYGFVMAGSALVGQCLGAGRPDRAELALRECSRLAVRAMSACGVGFLAFATPLTRVFVPGGGDEGVVALAALCLAISGLEQPFMALAMSLAGGLRGAGDTRSPLLVAVVGVWGVRVPLAWALAIPAGLGLAGIWITMIVDWAARGAVYSVLVRRGRWKSINL
jgi:putative MATE family efflux protein